MDDCPVHPREVGQAHFKGEGNPIHPDDYFVNNGEWRPGGEAWEKQLKAYEDCYCTCEANQPSGLNAPAASKESL